MSELFHIYAQDKILMEFSDFFFNTAGRLRSGWRFAIFVAIYFLLFISAQTFFFAILSYGPQPIRRALSGIYTPEIVSAAIFFLVAAIAGFICNRALEGLPWRALGWAFHRGWARDIFYGLLLGIASLLLAVGIATVGGGLRFSLNDVSLSSAIARTILSTLVMFIPAAAAEEMLFRGYPLQTFTRAGLAWLGLFLTSVPFSIVHLANPNVVPIFTFINTALAGAWLAVAFLRTRSLWLPLSLHFSWNWTMNAILGIPVSGITKFAPAPLLHAHDFGPAWLTGGDYGIEGGAACTLALLISSALIWRAKFLTASEEMLEGTNKENPKRKETISIYPHGNENNSPSL